jgi:TPR repeat protein
MNAIGNCYLDGHGVKMDLTLAHMWYKQAADLGDVLAMNTLGVLYMNGDLGSDYEKAFQYLYAASSKKFARAMSNLGILYLEGLGVVGDGQKASEWFQRAIDNGFSYPQHNLLPRAQQLLQYQREQLEKAKVHQWEKEHELEEDGKSPAERMQRYAEMILPSGGCFYEIMLTLFKYTEQ